MIKSIILLGFVFDKFCEISTNVNLPRLTLLLVNRIAFQE